MRIQVVNGKPGMILVVKSVNPIWIIEKMRQEKQSCPQKDRATRHSLECRGCEAGFGSSGPPALYRRALVGGERQTRQI